LQRSQGLCESPYEKAHPYARSCKLCRDDGPGGWPSARDHGQGATDAIVLSAYSANAQSHDCKLKNAPRMHSIPLPEVREDDEQMFNNGSDLSD
jgi:hypothetical protein